MLKGRNLDPNRRGPGASGPTAAGPRFGPNARAVEAFVARLDRLTDAQLLRLAAASHPPSRAEAAQARRAAVGRGEAAGRRPALEWAKDGLVQWATRIAIAPPSASFLDATAADVVGAESRRRAFPVLLDGLIATITRDLLTDDEFEALAWPWDEVTS